jgi:hypothetical protein
MDEVNDGKADQWTDAQERERGRDDGWRGEEVVREYG